jgi:glycosyltransferase involved in cell wall biosynthesis
MNDVTVLIPSYNHGSVLVYQLESILRQSLVPKRIIIMDDGSTDGTSEFLKMFQSNKEITVIRQPQNIGIHAVMDLLMDLVETEFFAFAAADDLLSREWCLTMSSLLIRYPSAKMALSNTFIWESGRFLVTNTINQLNSKAEGLYQPDEFVKLLTKHGRIPPSNPIMYRSDIINDVIRPVTSNKELLNLTDIFTILKIAMQYPVAYTLKPTGVWVKHDQGYSNSYFSKDQLAIALKNIDIFSTQNRHLCHIGVTKFLKRYVSYSWVKETVRRRFKNNRHEFVGIKLFFKEISSYAVLIFAFIVNKRFRFVRTYTRLENAREKLALQIDAKLFERFNIK